MLTSTKLFKQFNLFIYKYQNDATLYTTVIAIHTHTFNNFSNGYKNVPFFQHIWSLTVKSFVMRLGLVFYAIFLFIYGINNTYDSNNIKCICTLHLIPYIPFMILVPYRSGTYSTSLCNCNMYIQAH